jgi:hypothetical protein
MRLNFDPRTVLAQLGVAAALLICLAVVLNVGGFGKSAKLESAQASAATSDPQKSVARPQVTEAPQPEQHELLVKVADRAAPLRPTIEPTPDSSVAPAAGAQTAAAMQGVWAPGNACSLRSFREGALPTIINPDGAWAGETFCFFKNQKHLESGWSVIANCSNAREQWTNLVHLTIKGDRLIWASKRGTQTYTRCAPNFLMAEAR